MVRLTKRNIDKTMANMAALLKTDDELRDAFNGWLDELLDQDAFGTEGQLDPRGDNRDGER